MTSHAAHDAETSRLTGAFATAAEFALNSALRLDPYTQRRWARLSGKVVAVEMRGVDRVFHIAVDGDRLRVLAHQSAEPVVRIAGSPLALAKLTGPRALRTPALVEEVTFSGVDADVAAVRTLIDGFEIDWEEHLSRVVGDVIARQVGNAVRGAARWADQSAKALVADAGEYVRYESNQVPSATELDAFKRDVVALSERVDRLEARVRRLSTDGF